MSADERNRQTKSRRPTGGRRRRRREPSEEELRAAYEAELSRLTSDRHDGPGGRLAAEHRRAAAGAAAPSGDDGAGAPTRARPRAGARRDRRACGRCSRSSSAASRSELAPLRDALSRLQMAYAREVGPARRRPARQPARPTPARPGAAGRRRAASQDGDRAGRRRGARRARDRRSRAAGCGCPDAEATAPRRPARGRHSAGRHDTLRPRLHRVDARAERSGRQMCARQILARHANQTAEDFC